MNNTPVQYQNQAPAQRNILSMPIGQELAQLVEISKTLASCPFYQKIGAGGVLAVWLTARELNLPVMMSLNGGLYTFDGKVTMSAQLMNMMIVNAGHRADVIELTDKTCKLRFFRRDRAKGHGDTMDYEFNISMAEKAGYMSKTNWKNHTRDMLYSRCLSGGARKFMPDVLMNCYVFGEIEDKNFNDSHLINVLPDIQPEVKSEEPKQLENVKTEGYDEFVERHYIVTNSDGLDSPKREYVIETCKKANMTEIQVINSAIRNESLFEDRFEIWRQKKYGPLDKESED